MKIIELAGLDDIPEDTRLEVQPLLNVCKRSQFNDGTPIGFSSW